MFSRFCHFYALADDHVLRMPAKRFWCMEKQIPRIKAEETLRLIATDTSKTNEDGMRRILDSLTLEIGDTYQIIRPKFVKPDPNVREKFNSLM